MQKPNGGISRRHRAVRINSAAKVGTTKYPARQSRNQNAPNQTGPLHLPFPLCALRASVVEPLMAIIWGTRNSTTETQRAQRGQIIATARQCNLFVLIPPWLNCGL